MTVQYLIDSENVGDFWIPLLELPAKETELIVFYTRNSPHMSYDSLIRLKESERTVTFIKCYEGTNALDFQLVSELGYRICSNGDGRFVIVTNDTGFDAAVKYWRRRKKSVKRITGKECKNIERRVREDLTGGTVDVRQAVASVHLYTEDGHDANRDTRADVFPAEAERDNDARPSRPNLRDAELASQPEPEDIDSAEESGYDIDQEPEDDDRDDTDLFEYDAYADETEESAYDSGEDDLQEYPADDFETEDVDSDAENLTEADEVLSEDAFDADQSDIDQSDADQHDEDIPLYDADTRTYYNKDDSVPLFEDGLDDDNGEAELSLQNSSDPDSFSQNIHDADDDHDADEEYGSGSHDPFASDQMMHSVPSENGEEKFLPLSEEGAGPVDTAFGTEETGKDENGIEENGKEETVSEGAGAEEKSSASDEDAAGETAHRSKSRRSRSRRSKSASKKHSQAAGDTDADTSETGKTALSSEDDNRLQETDSADAAVDASSAALLPPGDEEIARIVACIGADNLAELHNQLATFYGDQGKDIYLSIKNNTRSLPVYKPDLKQKYAYYCEIIFSRSDYAGEYPSDISEFLLSVREKLNNLNSLRYALQKQYGKEKGRRFYFLLKPFAKTMYQM